MSEEERSEAAELQQLIREAVNAQATRQFGKARRLYEQLVEMTPDDPGALYGLALMEERHGNFERALSLLDDAIRHGPQRAVFHARRAASLLALGRFAEAVESAGEATRLDAGLAEAHLFAASALERSNRLDDAQEAIGRALSINPDDEHAMLIQGRLLRRAGRLDDAEGCLRGLLLRGTASSHLASQVHNELAFVLDKAGDYDEAFEHFVRGGGEKQRGARGGVSRGAYHERIREYRAALDEAQLATWRSRAASSGPAPAFLVGFPRSGTTMTEQIMAAHPDVITSDESMILHELETEAGNLCGGGDAGTNLRLLDEDKIGHLRSLYWRKAREHMGQDLEGAVFVDKLPLNITRLGLVNAVFPDARVIVALRDPRDVCLSCLMQDFRPNDAMVHFLSIEETAAFYREVMGFWLWLRERTTLEYIEVRYEDTVRDLEGQARRILEHLGVAWDDRVLAFHEAAKQRDISTPSYVAVVEPVHTRAVGRWQNYAHHLEPIAGELKPFVDAFGYG